MTKEKSWFFCDNKHQPIQWLADWEKAPPALSQNESHRCPLCGAIGTFGEYYHVPEMDDVKLPDNSRFVLVVMDRKTNQ